MWITAGREIENYGGRIENYVPSATLRVAVEAINPGRGAAVKKGRYDKALPNTTDTSDTTVDKVEVASEVEKLGAGLDVLDLKDKLKELAAFIRRANGLPPKP